MRWVFALATVLVVLWCYSVVRPEDFGSCTEVPVRFGDHPTVRDCQAYGPQTFAVPLAVLVIVSLLAGDGDFEIDLGSLGRYSRRREVQKAAQDLKDPALDERGEKFLRGLGHAQAPRDR